MNRPSISLLIVPLLFCAAGCDGEQPVSKDPAAQEVMRAQEAAEPAAPAAAANEGTNPADADAADVKKGVALYPALQANVDALRSGFDAIPEERRKQLEKLALFVQSKRASGETAKLTFICTHNSRRSHLSQLWAATAAAYYGVTGVTTHSGGTEATAFNPRAVAAVERAGFRVDKSEGKNPHYQVRFSDEAPAQECFSKKYDHPANPSSGFAAVMTCSEADKNCPLVAGASLRVGLPFVDPKESDGTPEEAATYDARSRQIGTEMFYLFSRIPKA